MSETTSASASYAAAGVDTAAGDLAVSLMKEAVAATHGPRVFGGFGGFAGLFDVLAGGMPQIAAGRRDQRGGGNQEKDCGEDEGACVHFHLAFSFVEGAESVTRALKRPKRSMGQAQTCGNRANRIILMG